MVPVSPGKDLRKMTYYIRGGTEESKTFTINYFKPLDYPHTRPWSAWDVVILERAIEDQWTYLKSMDLGYQEKIAMGRAMQNLHSALEEARKELGLE